ncbi:hypothetical protein L1994_10765 [Methanomicrobium antiquum]|uniref:Cell surface protein n=1 Tax=Methanomicrobium antiquum TaxID=487686 RepID=A0AAF0FNA4_9EURY|nr:hypothetical protein [Methanomicrobium antiquum]WFN36607.1 hypothetical protein L1994_10765 [Methanomicrobium antiquum]
MNLIEKYKKKVLQILVLLLSLCILIPATSAIDISGEEKTIFTAEEDAGIYAAIDSGNILIREALLDKVSSWSKFYIYNISEEKLEKIADYSFYSHNLAINKNIAVWQGKSEERDFVEGKYDVYLYNLDERNTPKIIVDKFNSVDDLTVGENMIIITGRNSIAESSDYDHGDIFVYNLEDESLTKHEFPGCQYGVAISEDCLVFYDDRYGQMKDTVHLMNFDTGKTRQIGDEKKGVYSNPDISGDKIVYKFDEDFGSFLKDSAPQQLIMTDIYTNDTTFIASPGVRIKSHPKIGGDNIVWTDKRNGKYSVWLYNLKEESEILISVTDEEYGGAVDISGDTVIWTDIVDGKDVLKLIKLDIPETSTVLTETPQSLEKSTAENDLEENPTQVANLSSGLTVAAVIFGLCFFVMRTINYKK